MTSQPVEQRVAPVQGYSAGIPWSMHLRAYDAYRKAHGSQKALIEGDCRGGFHAKELDDFIPGWREELLEIAQLRTALRAALVDAEAVRSSLIDARMEALGHEQKRAVAEVDAAQLREALRELAIRAKGLKDFRCGCCDFTWQLDQPENHAPGCLAAFGQEERK